MEIELGGEYLPLTSSYKFEFLAKLDNDFLNFLKKENPKNYQELLEARKQGINYDNQSNLIIALAPILEQFIANKFALNSVLTANKEEVEKINQLLDFKKLVIQRKILKKIKKEDLITFSPEAIEEKYAKILRNYSDQTFYEFYQTLDLEAQEEINQYIAYACLSEDGKRKYENFILFKIQEKIDQEDLCKVPNRTDKLSNISYKIDQEKLEYRDGFALTDKGVSTAKSLNEAHLCLYCHQRKKDSCRKGLNNKSGEISKSPQGIELKGCPLEEKISEMNLLKNHGFTIASLATAMIDNPLLAATGHRICNDCMKACIFQDREPVNIPAIETEILHSVLKLDYGFEIYSLLTRWNPLKIINYLPKPNSHNNILIVGQGPAGFNLAHHLLHLGHNVTAIDGLKIELLAAEINGINEFGQRAKFKPIKNIFSEIFQNLDQREPEGFGGVAEYGITVRWDKNLLKIIRIILERNQNYRLYGGVRFGSQITKEIAFNDLGFDHIALCQGSGSPNIIPIKNNLINGVRKASDFLMSLQLSGAFLKNSLANLQLRLPVLVVGGGLTAIDTATECLAYYPRQVLKFYDNFYSLNQKEQERFLSELNIDEQEIFSEFIAHAKLFKTEEEQAAKANKKANFVKIIRNLGGVRIIYRKSLKESPAYRLNHEEVKYAFLEGVEFLENITPLAAIPDEFSRLKAVNCENHKGEFKLEARSLLIAAGTKPNISSSFEDKDLKVRNGFLEKITADTANKHNISNEFITYINAKKQAISFFGDLHPDYNGNVVKAMASSKKGALDIDKLLDNNGNKQRNNFFQKLDQELIATVESVEELAPKIYEVVVKAPLAARNFQPGQFYRLQNFSKYAQENNKHKLLMEGLALTGASADKEKGLISLIILEMGGSSDLCRKLKIAEPIILMGPTGTPTEIYKNKTVMLVGGGLGNAVLFSIGKALKQNGCKVLYFAGYKKNQDRYKISEIQAASDVTVWACDEENNFNQARSQDKIFTGNIIAAIENYASGKLGRTNIKIEEVEHIVAIGSDRMMRAVKEARNKQLVNYLNKNHNAVGSINSPMQCMMKEICAQCLQKHIDPATKKESFVFSCNNQDQNLDLVCFDNLNARLKQNSLLEKVTKFMLKL